MLHCPLHPVTPHVTPSELRNSLRHKHLGRGVTPVTLGTPKFQSLPMNYPITLHRPSDRVGVTITYYFFRLKGRCNKCNTCPVTPWGASTYAMLHHPEPGVTSGVTCHADGQNGSYE